MRKYLFIGVYILLFFQVGAQSDSTLLIDQNDLENIVENQEIEGEIDVFNTIDQLEAIYQNRMNLNIAQYDELNSLRILSEFQIKALLQYRQKFGKLLSIYELQAIPGWDVSTIRRIIPFSTVEEQRFMDSDFSTMFSNGKHDVFIKLKRVLSQRIGFNDLQGTDYVGDPNHLYLRYRYNYSNKLRWGFTAEKDSGEQFFQGANRNGFDFYSAFLFYNDPTANLRNLIVGDFTISMGQGLIMHNSFGSGKSSEVINIVKGGASVRPYSSVNESQFLRGFSGTYNFNKYFQATAFASHKYNSGNLLQDTVIDAGFETFSSIRIDGYHRTENEIFDKNSVGVTNMGTILRYNNPSLKVGINYLYTSFDKILNPTSGLYRQFIFSGNRLHNYSLDALWQFRSFNLFSEYARSDNSGDALVLGSQAVIHPKLDISLVYRNYSEKYQVLNANAFGEHSAPVNERGLYVGLAYRPDKSWQVSLYHDVWKSPWLRFRVDAPSNGKESFIRIQYRKKYRHLFYVQYKYEQRPLNYSVDEPIRKVFDRDLYRLRIHYNNIISKTWELRNRIEFSRFNSVDKNTTGWLFYQDVIYHHSGFLKSLTARIAYFDTDDFDSRIYAYENDILYEFRIPFYQNEGIRFYINSRWNLSKRVSFEFRFENTSYFDRQEIGSSGETIFGTSRSEIKSQLRFQF